MKRIIAATLVLLSLVFVQIGAQTITYAKKNIEVIIPKNPGGGTDTSARTILEFAKGYLPKGIIFVPANKPAGNGITGLIEVANAKPDGYTLVMATVELAMFPHQGKSPVTYENFTPIVATIADPSCFIVRADSPYKTLKDFVAAAKANPGKLTVANSGMGAIYHLAALKMEKTLGIKVNHVPYNEGAGPEIAALVGGHVDAVIATPGTAKSQVDAGVLKILGIMDDQRFSLTPTVPTFKEALELDFAFNVRAWAVLCAPAKLPKDITDQLVAAFGAVVKSPEYQAAMRKQNIEPVVILGNDALAMMKADHETYKDLLAQIGR